MPDVNPERSETSDETTPTDTSEAAETLQVSSSYKVLGEFSDVSGAGVLGKNNAGSGTPIGVEGAVPNATDGYGLATPDDANVAGTMATTDYWEVLVDDTRALFLGSENSGNAGNVIHGHSSNTVQDGAEAATIGGGGFDDGSTVTPNEVYDNFGTVAGGVDNQAGSPDGDPTTAPGATVCGGEANTANDVNATVGGGFENTAGNFHATVAGGLRNTASQEESTIGGGQENEATGRFGIVSGGKNNTAGSGSYATVGGGQDNTASHARATIAGGNGNSASAARATVGGGSLNTASGLLATVPGGYNNTADGDYSFAAGREADTNGHDGAFVLGDSSSTAITAEGADEVRSQMPMYAPSFNSTSARAAKTNIVSVDPEMVLDGVESLDVNTWEFTEDYQSDGGRHMGPMAEDFHDTFELGADEGTIATVDADGVAFAAIQGLSQKLAERTERIDELQVTVEQRDDRIEELERETDNLKAENTVLRERLDELEDQMATIAVDDTAPAPTDD